jgi:hypothetical protein
MLQLQRSKSAPGCMDQQWSITQKPYRFTFCLRVFSIFSLWLTMFYNHIVRMMDGLNICNIYTVQGVSKKGNRTSARYCIWITLHIFHIRKDHAFSCWMISSSCQMDKKWANTNTIKNVSQNRIFSPLRVGSKTIENEPPLVLKLMNFTSINDAHIHNYY